MESAAGEKRFNAFLAEFTDAWLLVAGLPGVILIFPRQSLIVRCGGSRRIEITAAGIYQGAADTIVGRGMGRIVNQ
jgi:hypothetical protein